MATSLLKEARGRLLPPDSRSAISASEIYAAPIEVAGSIQIIRPFAVLSKNAYSAPVTLPIGPAYLAATLAKAGYRVGIIDAVGEAIQQITRTKCDQFNIQGLSTSQIVERLDPGVRVIGVSMMFSQEWVEHRVLIKALRAARPNAVIVAGGEHATAMPEYILRDCPEIDYVVSGEGELTFLELCHKIFCSTSTGAVRGICFIDQADRFITTGLSRRIATVDELPTPAWDRCCVDNYFIDNWTMGIAMGRNMPILATRGCPYQCTFCSNPAMWTTRYLMRDPKAVVDEIEFLIREYGANSIDFFDLTAIVKKQWILAFCAELAERNVKITWQLPSGTRSEALDAETLLAIYEAGCRFLVYAPESGSEETLRKIKKKLRLPRLIKSVRAATAIGHTVKINLIIGLPHERLRNVLQTILFACKLALMGAEDCNISVFTPYPGSELFNELRESGVISAVDDNYFRSLIIQFDLTASRSFAPRLRSWQLLIARICGQSLFYLLSYSLHPNRIVRLLRGLCSSGRFQPSNLFEQRISDFLARRRLTKTGRVSLTNHGIRIG